MIQIITNSIEIYKVFNDAFRSVTEKLTSIQLKQHEEEIELKDNFITGIVDTKGVFHALIVCQMQSELFNKVVLEMNSGDELPMEDKILYIKEYLNIICGKALSDINNQLGKRSKLSVPHIIQGGYEFEEKQEYLHNQNFNYLSKFGNMNVRIYYKFLPLFI